MDLALLLPASLTEESPDPRIRTYKVGTVGRAAAVFGVDEVVLFPDPASGLDAARFIGTVLSYQATAPYLRRHVFPKTPLLQYAGVLPPLNVPTHTVDSTPREGELREVLVEQSGRVRTGADRKAVLEVPEEGEVAPGTRLVARVEVVDREAVLLVPASLDDPAVRRASSFGVTRAGSLAEAAAGFDAAWGTSRHGTPVAARAPALREVLAGDGRLAVAFGPPLRGLHEILEAEGSDPQEVLGEVLNTFPDQRTGSVRSEEAVWGTLALLNALREGL